MIQHISKELIVIGSAMLPYLELRGAIPIAWKLGLSAPEAYILAVIGNVLPIIPIMLFVRPVTRWLARFSIFKLFFKYFFAKCRRHEGKINKLGYWGLALFVAIPLPMTGAWSGAVIAFLMGMRKRYAFISIFAGILIAGLIILIMTYGLARFFKLMNS